MKEINLNLRNYQIGNLYGPGMLPSGEEGYHTKGLIKQVDEIGLVLVHCWNVGEANGPYPLNDRKKLEGRVSDWVIRAHEIISHKINPVLNAARKKGVKVFHLAQSVYADRYPKYIEIKNDPTLKDPIKKIEFQGSVRPGTIEAIYKRQYGKDFPGPIWQTHPDALDIAEAVKPLREEAVFLDGWQLNGLCRRLNIDTLIYAGFMADLCMMNIPGAIREMGNRFGYNCILLRDCTTAYEYSDTRETFGMTDAAIRIIETDLGYSALSDDFINAIKQ